MLRKLKEKCSRVHLLSVRSRLVCRQVCGFHGIGVWFPVVSLVPSSTTGWELSSLRDEESSMSGTSGSPSLGARARAAMKGMDGMERGGVGICCGLRAVIRWCRVAQPPVTGWHPCRGANL
jgi:hypothetical protein